MQKTIDGKKVIPFSPPDISEAEIKEVVETLRSGWITTGPRVKLLERRLAAYIETGKTDVDTEREPAKYSNRLVCLSSATAAEELNLRVFAIAEKKKDIFTPKESDGTMLGNLSSRIQKAIGKEYYGFFKQKIFIQA